MDLSMPSSEVCAACSIVGYVWRRIPVELRRCRLRLRSNNAQTLQDCQDMTDLQHRLASESRRAQYHWNVLPLTFWP